MEQTTNATILLDFCNFIENELCLKMDSDKRKIYNEQKGLSLLKEKEELEMQIGFAKWVQNENYFWDELGMDNGIHKKGTWLWMQEYDGIDLLVLKTSEELLKEYKNEKHSTQC